MTYDRVHLRRTKAGPIIAVLFGATIEGQIITAEACFMPEPIKRSISAKFENLNVRIPKNVAPGFYGAIFSSEIPQFEVIQ